MYSESETRMNIYRDSLKELEKNCKQESDIEQVIKMFASTLGCTLMRNNCGAGFLAQEKGAPATNWIRFGLNNESDTLNDMLKSSDQIGITTITITPEMVGQKIGVFTAVEAKKPGWKRSKTDKHEKAQQSFIDLVLNAGGYAGFASCLDDLVKIIRR